MGINQLQSQTRITASIIAPTLEIEPNSQIRWAQPAVHRQLPSTSFRLSPPVANRPSMVNVTKKIERVASTSLQDLPLNPQRT